MNITIVTTAGNDERALFLLRELGMPFAALGGVCGDDCEDREGDEEAEVRGAAPQPLPGLRPAARLSTASSGSAASASGTWRCRAICPA